MHENRETSLVPAPAGRSGKANNHNPDTHAGEESDCSVVPMKRPNNEASAAAEAVEGRAQTKENDAGPGTSPTQRGERVPQGLGGVRQAARERKQERFTALLHHLTVDLLRESYYALKPRGPGSRRGEMERVRGRPGRSAKRSPRPGTPGSVPGPGLAKSVHTESRRPAAAVGHRGAGGQDRSTGGGEDPQ